MPQVLASPPRATGRLAGGLVLAGGLLAVVALAGLAVGSRPLPVGEVRAALAVAGVLAQGLTRNPHR